MVVVDSFVEKSWHRSERQNGSQDSGVRELLLQLSWLGPAAMPSVDSHVMTILPGSNISSHRVWVVAVTLLRRKMILHTADFALLWGRCLNNLKPGSLECSILFLCLLQVNGSKCPSKDTNAPCYFDVIVTEKKMSYCYSLMFPLIQYLELKHVDLYRHVTCHISADHLHSG